MKTREFEIDLKGFLIKGQEVTFQDLDPSLPENQIFVSFYKKETDPLGNSYVRRINEYNGDFQDSFELAVLLAKELVEKNNA